MNKKLLVILGPTATGKTDLALLLAKKFNGELIACDSRQVYKGLDIGTGKLPSGVKSPKADLAKGGNAEFRVQKGERWWEIKGIKIWMYDIVDPESQYTVADYIKDATKVIKDISSRDKLPIIVGGTGLYLKALLEGLDNLQAPVDKSLREELERSTREQLQERLKNLSTTKWESLNLSDQQNPRRLLRSIELLSTNPYIDATKDKGLITEFEIFKIGLTAPREELYKKADLRVLSRLDQGMIEEAQRLYRNGLTLQRMKELGLEYGVLADFLNGVIKTKEEFIKILQNKIHGYIRRQLTWFKKEKDVIWFDISNKHLVSEVEKLTSDWYN